MTPAHLKVDGKSNEIPAVKEILNDLDVKGATVTLDAMGCQRDIAQKIVDKGGDYIMGLKGNQGTLEKDAKELFPLMAKGGRNCDVCETVDGGHGRIETRACSVIKDASRLQKLHDWPHLKTLVKIESTRETGDKTSQETRYYIASGELTAAQALAKIRSHWSIENSLHHVHGRLLQRRRLADPQGQRPGELQYHA